MFYNLRISRLERKIEASKIKVELLKKAEREYERGYYTNRLIDEAAKLTGLCFDLEKLKGNEL